MSRREYEKALEAEVAHWPGVTLELLEGSKHPKARYTFEGNMLSHPYAGTPSDSAFGIHRLLGDHRRILKRLGATRDKPEPTKDEDEAPYRKPNEGAAKRPNPVQAEKAEPQPDIADQLEPIGVATAPRRVRELIVITDEGESEAEALAAARREQTEGMIAAIAASDGGVFFDLPEEVYFGVPALGGGAVCDLIVSPGTFWRGSWLDPDKPPIDDDATKAQIIGRAYHCARLEPHKLDERFMGELDKSTMPKGALFTGTDMGKELEERGLKKSGSVAEQAERLADDGYPLEKLWHVALINWKRELAGRQPIDAKTWHEIQIDMQRIQQTPAVWSRLEGGAAEVAVFWRDEHGIPCKAKFDKLTATHWAELKTFDNSRKLKIEQAIANAVRYNRYYVAAAHYREAAEAIRVGGLQVRGAATPEQRELIAQIQRRLTPLDCWFVFQEKKGIPNLLTRRFEFTQPTGSEEAIAELERMGASDDHLERARRFAEISGSEPQHTGIYRLALTEIRHAKQQFALYSEVYQPGEPWAPLEPEGTIGDIDFSPYWLDGRD